MYKIRWNDNVSSASYVQYVQIGGTGFSNLDLQKLDYWDGGETKMDIFQRIKNLVLADIHEVLNQAEGPISMAV